MGNKASASALQAGDPAAVVPPGTVRVVFHSDAEGSAVQTASMLMRATDGKINVKQLELLFDASDLRVQGEQHPIKYDEHGWSRELIPSFCDAISLSGTRRIPTHPHHQCDRCSACPLVGSRFHCKVLTATRSWRRVWRVCVCIKQAGM